ncbi:MAG TPA: PAS domain S-box protein, partial [Vicinamibacterales bacterium]|nr:PAS domain S-box protein [Vicinamibacterales bacterium]
MAEPRTTRQPFVASMTVVAAMLAITATSGGGYPANRRVEAMFGYAPDELKDKPYEILIPAAYLEAHRTL